MDTIFRVLWEDKCASVSDREEDHQDINIKIPINKRKHNYNLLRYYQFFYIHILIEKKTFKFVYINFQIKKYFFSSYISGKYIDYPANQI